MRDCAIIYREGGEGGGGWKTRGGHRGNHDEREGELNVKFYTFVGGHYLFLFPFINWKKGRGAIRV